MKKVQLVTPEKFQWLEGYWNTLEKDYKVEATKKAKDIRERDCIVFLWCNQDTTEYINSVEKGDTKYIVYIRRYEMFSPFVFQLDWSKVDEIVFVNGYLQKMFEKRFDLKTNLIYNGINPEKWTFKERSHGKKIAWVGWLNAKKNLPLAMNILGSLQPEYELHIAGGIQDESIVLHMFDFAEKIKRRIVFCDRIDPAGMDMWLEDKNYILSTAHSEGNPNNVIEAMAKGIKPVVYNWPDAQNQFREFVFNTVGEALLHFGNISEYNSSKYRMIVEHQYGQGSYDALKRLVDKVLI